MSNLEGLDDFLRALEQLKGLDMTDALQAGGDVLLKGAHRRVRVDTGELRDSLHVVVAAERGHVAAQVETNNDHALPNEFGTAHMPAQSFLRATVDEDGDKAVDVMAAKLGKQIEGVGS